MHAVKEILGILGRRKVYGNTGCGFDGLNLCNRETGRTSILSYATSGRYLDTVGKNTAVKILIVQKDDCSYNRVLAERDGCVIFSEEPEKDFYKVHEALYEMGDFYEQYDFESETGEGCVIHPSAVIDRGVRIGNGVKIGALTVVKKGTVIEDGVEIGCNSVIGSEGFQVIAAGGGEPLHVTHAGGVHICKNAYVGDCTCIANSLFEGATYIGRGVRIDNLVHVGHNLHIGDNAVVTAHVILCGSVVVGRGAWIAPNSSILNRVVVGECATVGMGSVVTHDVPARAVAYGAPAKVKKMK